MSVKMMPTDQIRDDLETIQLTWPDGVPWQQNDRVTALKTELKRRGEPAVRPDGVPSLLTKKAIASATTDELETELRALSTRSDEGSQERFADVRFELRRRAKQLEADEPKVKPRSSVVPRELELPSDDEVGRPTAPLPVARPIASSSKAAGPRLEERPKKVRGFSVAAREDGRLLIQYQTRRMDGGGDVSIWQSMTIRDLDQLVAMAAEARAIAVAAHDKSSEDSDD